MDITAKEYYVLRAIRSDDLIKSDSDPMHAMHVINDAAERFPLDADAANDAIESLVSKGILARSGSGREYDPLKVWITEFGGQFIEPGISIQAMRVKDLLDAGGVSSIVLRSKPVVQRLLALYSHEVESTCNKYCVMGPVPSWVLQGKTGNVYIHYGGV